MLTPPKITVGKITNRMPADLRDSGLIFSASNNCVSVKSSLRPKNLPEQIREQPNESVPDASRHWPQARVLKGSKFPFASALNGDECLDGIALRCWLCFS